MKNAWNYLGLALVGYSLVYGLISTVPALPIVNETIRNLYYHVPMWFTMISLMGASFGYSIGALQSNSLEKDRAAAAFSEVALVFAAAGLLTGMLWAKFTWGAFWTPDPKLNGTAITILIYLAYFVLRGSVDDPEKRLRLSATYNIFAFVLMLVFIMVLPRLTDSLHPGNGGNPAFGAYDLDNTMRLVFYPAVVGWILVGFWMARLRARLENLRQPLDLH
ncbi:MAG: cytochrome c biogenesis protein [Schleiferiaceae bacterium]|jgi:heme exporter protein C|nr:cytochrome c biogenesis protein [Schleiferiaceae bacterium]MDP4627964.1 cytochrome c biogenesis protein [Schleiferiaceae bacterium]MDP4727820.1 cytochrome c biogenesis protein [Schleiferiaceae bacterium]MDP4749211.1 cytochrome c biogenesis protein [Schleiferiaceae bacterium]MDP4858629.1 cytochrome c biogenesis protein [Schleiferiaceae bacterium]